MSVAAPDQTQYQAAPTNPQYRGVAGAPNKPPSQPAQGVTGPTQQDVIARQGGVSPQARQAPRASMTEPQTAPMSEMATGGGPVSGSLAIKQPATRAPPGGRGGIRQSSSGGGFDIFGSIEAGAGQLYGGLETGFSDLFTLGVKAGVGVKTLATGGDLKVTEKPSNIQNLQVGGVAEPQAAQAAGQTAAYLTPGAAALKGVGSPGESASARAFDVGVGVLPFVPLGELGAVGRVAGSTAGRAALGGAIGAAGGVAYGESPEGVAVSAATGAAGFAIGGKILGKLTAEPGPPERTPVPTQSPLGEPGEPIPSHAPEPVAGGGLEQAMEIGPKGEPLGISEGAKPIGQGMATTAPEETQPPRDISLMLQDVEGVMPTKGGTYVQGLETEPARPPPPPSRGQGPDPYTGSYGGETKLEFGDQVAGQGGAPIAFDSEYGNLPGGRDLSGPMKPLDYGASPGHREGEPMFTQKGPSGPGGPGSSGGPSAGGRLTEEEVYARYPPGSDAPRAGDITALYNPAMERVGLFNESGQGVEPIPGLGTIPFMAPVGTSALKGRSTGITPDLGQTPDVGQVPAPGQTTVPGITTVTTPKTTTTPDLTPYQSEVPTPPALIQATKFTEGGLPFPFLQPGADRRTKSKRVELFGYSQKRTPVPLLFDFGMGGGGLDLGPKKKGRSRKK